MKWWLVHVRQRPERVAELNALGFVWERLQPEWNLVLEALISYKSIHGNLLVPSAFVVPRTEQYLRATWGIYLGNCVYRIRARYDFLRGEKSASRRNQLEKLGFEWDAQEYRFGIFYAALLHFARLSKSGPFRVGERMKALRVPCKYIVPSNDQWPVELWGYPLGDKCTAVRQKKLYVKGSQNRRRQSMLIDLGFRFSGNANLAWLKVVHAGAIYSRLNGRNLDVPLNFVVPKPLENGQHEEWPWPEHLWGLKLGQRLKDVRIKGAYINGDEADSRRRQLDALGFNWAPKRGRRSAKPTDSELTITNSSG
jgi:hypothetical protein